MSKMNLYLCIAILFALVGMIVQDYKYRNIMDAQAGKIAALELLLQECEQRKEVTQSDTLIIEAAHTNEENAISIPVQKKSKGQSVSQQTSNFVGTRVEFIHLKATNRAIHVTEQCVQQMGFRLIKNEAIDGKDHNMPLYPTIMYYDEQNEYKAKQLAEMIHDRSGVHLTAKLGSGYDIPVGSEKRYFKILMNQSRITK